MEWPVVRRQDADQERRHVGRHGARAVDADGKERCLPGVVRVTWSVALAPDGQHDLARAVVEFENVEIEAEAAV